MKNYIDIYKKQDAFYLKTIKNSIKLLQTDGNYPTEFKMPLTIQMELTGKCNLRCLHCYNRSGEADIKTLLSSTDWIDIVKNIVNDGGVFQCVLSGGEPLLLGNKIFDIMDILHNDGTSFVIISNGFLMDKIVVEKLSKYRFYWTQISIDGYNSALHDSFRGVEGSWEKAVNGAYYLSAYGLPLVVAHTATPQNIPYLSNVAELAYQLGASGLIIGEVLPSGRANINNDIFLSLEQRNEMYGQIENLRNHFNGKMNVQRSSSVKNQLERYVAEPNMGVIIRPNGDVRLDCMAPFIIGNVLKKTLKEIWIEKGRKCWLNPLVQEYINSIDDKTNLSNKYLNYISNDIEI